MNENAGGISRQEAEKAPNYKALLHQSLVSLKEMRARIEALEQERREPIALLGLGCRFPRGVVDAASFWRLLIQGEDAISEVPASRWDIDAYYDPNPGAPGKMVSRWGGFLDDVEGFDASFFGITPREAMNMDPQQRLALEVAWEALEHAGQAIDALKGSSTGIFLGASSSDYALLGNADPALMNAYVASGTSHSVIAGRISYLLDLRGPSVALDTACSSSLVAVHLAMQSLRARECSLALAGGVNLTLSPLSTLALSHWGMLAADGRCKTFDRRADGFVRGEGCGIVVLKRLSDALRAGDPILAVLYGSAVNQDGRSAGLTAPNLQAQQEVIRLALAQAEIRPQQVSYVEAHGTGTSLGDPIEVEALKGVLGRPRTSKEPPVCWLGSVKTNLGHTEATAGIAGLIKVVLSLQQQQIPPHLHFLSLNPNIQLDGTPFAIPTQAQPWPRQAGQPRYAGVSSFGFSGTNAHVIVGEAPEQPEPGYQEDLSRSTYWPLPISARSPQALRELVQRYAEYLAQTPVALDDLCATAALRRSHHPFRHLLLAQSQDELLASCQSLLQQPAEETAPPAPRSSEHLVFVFPGQGSQWRGMGRELWRGEPLFRQALHDCAQAMDPWLDWSLEETLLAEEREEDLARIDVVQPLLCALQIALARLWMAWGLSPTALIGHSMGEVAAAHLAGLLSLADAARIICLRSRLLRRLRGLGAMALLEAEAREVESWIAEDPSHLSLAACNGPRSFIVSGHAAAVDSLLHRLQAQGRFARRVPVEVASHSPLVDSLRADLLEALHGLRAQQGQIPLWSTVTSRWLEAADLTPAYWAENLRQPVQFWRGVQHLLEQGASILLEISPHPVLVPAMQEGVRHQKSAALALGSLKRQQPERLALLQGLARLYERGAALRWSALFPQPARVVPLPAYPWQRSSFWLEAPGARKTQDGSSETKRNGISAQPAAFALLGQRLRSPLHDSLYETVIDRSTFTFLGEHRVSGQIIFPAAVYLLMALSAISAMDQQRSYALIDTLFVTPFLLTDAQPRVLQIVLSPQQVDAPATAGTWSISGVPEQGSVEEERPWRIYASGQWRQLAPAEQPLANGKEPAYQEVLAHPTQEMSGDEYYQRMRACGFEYGPSFQGVQHLWLAQDAALGLIHLPASLSPQNLARYAHPALLDACFQVFSAALFQQMEGRQGDYYLPARIERISIYRDFPEQIWSYAVLQRDDEAQQKVIKGYISLFDQAGALLARIEAFQARQAKKSFLAGNASAWLEPMCYQLQWHPQAQPAHTDKPKQVRSGAWLIFAGQNGPGHDLAALLRDQGVSCVIVRPDSTQTPEEQVRQVLDEVSSGPWSDLVYLWGLDLPFSEEMSAQELLNSQYRSCQGLLAVVQALLRGAKRPLPRLRVVTRGAQYVDENDEELAPAQAPLWGFGRALLMECPELRSVFIDLDPVVSEAEAETLYTELNTNEGEEQVAYRNHRRYVARLEHYHPQPSKIRETLAASAEADQPFRLKVTTRGALNNLTLQPVQRRSPGVGEVEIQIYATGVNFRDILNVLGAYPGDPGALGSECAGKIVAIGEGVTDLQVNDRVVAAFSSASFSGFLTLPAAHVVRIPGSMSFAEAAAFPIVFLTAYYGLHVLGKIKAGESVLIHSAAGGVGLAAVQLALRAGATIYATAGNARKRAYLRSLGLQHVMDSRTLDFARDIREHTHGQGVDLVLNALTGDALAHSLSLLAPGGRFIELGKTEIWDEKRLAEVNAQTTYLPLDMGQVFQENPVQVRSCLAQLLQKVEQGQLKTLPSRIFPLSKAEEAFRFMAQARHIGKIVIAQPVRTRNTFEHLRADGWYLITGGLGGLGLVFARWMAEHGARALALLGRSEPSIAAREVLHELEERGTQIRVLQVDVSQMEEMREALAALQLELGPLHGIIHAAGSIRDGVLMQQTWQDLASVMAPKIAGAWNLHQLTRSLPLDFFVLCSSMASLLGSAGQSNYAAANAFLDTLALYRRNRNLPATSISWGPWSRVGLAAREQINARMSAHGMQALSPEQGCAAVAYVLTQDIAHLGVSPIHWPALADLFTGGTAPGFLKALLGEDARRPPSSGQAGSMRSHFAQAHPGQRLSLLTEHIRAQVNKVMGLPPTYRIDERQGFFEVGMDSLMAVELKNLLSNSLQATLPATVIFDYPTISALTAYFAGEVFGWQKDAEIPSIHERSAEVETREAVLEKLEALSDDQVESLLLEKLAHITERTRLNDAC
jgi:acyl transferase domain-containing protein/acyl carrier protein